MRPDLCSVKEYGKCGWAIREPDLADVQKYSSFHQRRQLPVRQILDRKNKSDAVICFRPLRPPDNRALRCRENIAERGLGECGPERPCGSKRLRSNSRLFGSSWSDRQKQISRAQPGAREPGYLAQTASLLRRLRHKNDRRTPGPRPAKACPEIHRLVQRLRPIAISKKPVADPGANPQNQQARRSIQSAASLNPSAAF